MTETNSSAPGARSLEGNVPRLRRGVKLRHDAVRDNWVLLAPEKAFVLDEIALEILKRVDGVCSLGAIVDDLSAAFAAPREVVLTDVAHLLSDLSYKGGVEL